MSAKRFRFIVSSAEEAVKVLRDRIGENARVISVRQVEGTGLAKFLQAPKLEVIAEVVDPTEPTANSPQPTPISLDPPLTSPTSPTSPVSPVSPVSPISPASPTSPTSP
ncbi:MAG: hypothetical protein WCI46_11475, partial [Verrucomicrobiota bacterium]